MQRDEALQLLSPRLYDLLGIMFSAWARWMPDLGYPRESAMLSTGGRVTVDSYEDLECECDRAGVLVVEAAFCDLSPAERLVIEQVMQRIPWVFTARDGVLESAISKLEDRLRRGGVML